MLTVLTVLAGPGTALAAKVDSVVLANGNVVTGEIKELNERKLRYSTDSMGTVRIEWDEIDQVVGKAYGEGGAVVNYTENSDGSSDTKLEGLFRAGWEIYIYNSPKRSLETTLALFPGITELGEYRSAFDVTLRQELFDDFFWDMSFYHQYDSDVADEDASNSDYGVNTPIGYEF